MTDDLGGEPRNPYDPGSMALSSLSSGAAAWYKRPWFLIALGVVVVLGVSIVTDLPSHMSPAQDAAEQNAYIAEINTDIAPCVYGVKESFSFYQEQLDGRLTPSDLSQVPELLVGDQTVCSFTSEGIYDLTNNIDVNMTAAGTHVNDMLNDVVLWTTSDALAAIEDIQYLFEHPHDTAKIKNLAKQEVLLRRDGAKIQADYSAAESVLGVKLTKPDIPVLRTITNT
ncbi:MAG: hypothetical protein ABSC34_09690 [Acidimicrobiales bacterium]